MMYYKVTYNRAQIRLVLMLKAKLVFWFQIKMKLQGDHEKTGQLKKGIFPEIWI